jgi:tetratricopeptide (TPR) repeat protein
MKRYLNIKNLKAGLVASCIGISCLIMAGAPAVRAEPIEGTEAILSDLFNGLSDASTFDEAQHLSIQIWEIWVNNNDDASNLELMQRGINYMDSGNWTVAEEVFSQIIKRDPSYTEAWNKRATVRFLLEDMLGSERDIHEVLTREPRHFGALSGLGMIKIQQNSLEDALQVYRDILEINPYSLDAAMLIPELESALRGEPI